MNTIKSLFNYFSLRISFPKIEGLRETIFFFAGVIILFLSLVFMDRYIAVWATIYHLIAFIAIVILLGVSNNFLLKKAYKKGIPDWAECMLTLTANLIGVLVFMSVSPNSGKDYYIALLLPALHFYSFPFFFNYCIKAIMSIPKLKFEAFRISNLKDIVAQIDWAEDNTKGIVWAFENISENAEDGKCWVRTHTPFQVNEIPLQELFKCLLSLHNHNLNPGQPIHFEKEGQAFEWRFYYEKKYFFGKRTRPLDPQKTIRENRVKFKSLPQKEYKNLENIRKGLSEKFKTTKILIVRNAPILEEKIYGPVPLMNF